MIDTLRVVADIPVYAKWEECIVVEEGYSLKLPLVVVVSPNFPFEKISA